MVNKSEKDKLIKLLEESIKQKIKDGWSEDIGAGFIAEDIIGAMLNTDGSITLGMLANNQNLKIEDLNLRETKELLKFLENEDIINMMRKNKPVSFRVTEDDFERVIRLLDLLRNKQRSWFKPNLWTISRSEFFRLLFKEGIKSLEYRMSKSNPYLCEKCGKRLAITLPRHLRKRLDCCECDKK
jgi:hypothetical protein